MLQLAFLVGFSQTDTVEVDNQTDTIKVIHENEIGVDVSPVVKWVLDSYNGGIGYRNNYNVFYKRHLNKNNYLRFGINFLDQLLFSSDIGAINRFDSKTNNAALVSTFAYENKLQDYFLYAGYEKRFESKYIQPLMSLDFIFGKYSSNTKYVAYELGDSLFKPLEDNIDEYRIAEPEIVYSNNGTNLYKTQFTSQNNGYSVGLVFKGGFNVNLSKRLYLLAQSGGSLRWLIGNYKDSSSNSLINDRKITEVNFDLLIGQTNLMIGYRF